MTKKLTYLFYAEFKVHRQVRSYFECARCSGVFVPTNEHLSLTAEKELYDQHSNCEEDQSYRSWLSPVFEALDSLSLDKKSERVLDYGCGPNPALQAWLGESGYEVDVYDKVYHPEIPGRYAVVTCTEVVEHFRNPEHEWSDLFEAVERHLIVMTQYRPETKNEFERWGYPKEATHIFFYNEKTMRWIAERFGYNLKQVRNLVVFSTPAERSD